MDVNSAFTLGTIRGIAIRVHWSWIAIFALIAWSLAEGVFGEAFTGWAGGTRYAAAVVTAVLFFGSVLLHELSHSFVALYYGMHVPSITLFIFGGVASLGGEMRTAGQEFRIAIAGPLMSWFIGLVFGGIWLLTRDFEVSAIFGYLGFINVLLGAFNLLPGFPLDGGRVFRSIVWARTRDLMRATRIAAQVGVFISYVMMALGVIVILGLGQLAGLWYILIGLFLKSASEGSYASLLVETALRNVSVASVMRPPPEPVHAVLSLQRLVDERVLTMAERAFLVEDGGRVVGLITTSDLAKHPRDEWNRTTVQQAMVPTDKVITVLPETELLEAMKQMQEHDIHQLPVIEDGQVLGMLTRGDVMQQIQLRTEFTRRSDRVARDA